MDIEMATAAPRWWRVLALDWLFLGICALLFLASVAVTIYLSRSMSGNMPMSGDMVMSDGTASMEMSGDATSSMMWTKLPEQSWFSAAASFMSMWVVMMVAMMLPSLVPTLLSYRHYLRGLDKYHLGALTVFVAVGYFAVWTIFGAVAYPLGVGLTAAEAQWSSIGRLAPVATVLVLLCAGCFQFTAWKTHQLACCRDTSDLAKMLPASAKSAWQYGLRLGFHCVLCCFGLMTILLITGVMNLGIMVLVATGITVERLAPRANRVAQALGVAIIVAGIVMIYLLGIVS
jgi:predicted metal-binding membrane protein